MSRTGVRRDPSHDRRVQLHAAIDAARAGGIGPAPLDHSWLEVWFSSTGRVLHTDKSCTVVARLDRPIRAMRKVAQIVGSRMCILCSPGWLGEQWAAGAQRVLDAHTVVARGGHSWSHLVELRRIQSWPSRPDSSDRVDPHPWQVAPMSLLADAARQVAAAAGDAADRVELDWARWADAAAGWFDTVGRVEGRFDPLDQCTANAARGAYHRVTWAGGGRGDARSAARRRGLEELARQGSPAGGAAALDALLDAVESNYDTAADTTPALVLLPDLRWGDRRVEWLCAPARRWFPRGEHTWGLIEVPATVARWLDTFSGALRPRRPDGTCDGAVMLRHTREYLDPPRGVELAWQLHDDDPGAGRRFPEWWHTAAAVLAT